MKVETDPILFNLYFLISGCIRRHGKLLKNKKAQKDLNLILQKLWLSTFVHLLLLFTLLLFFFSFLIHVVTDILLLLYVYVFRMKLKPMLCERVFFSLFTLISNKQTGYKNI